MPPKWLQCTSVEVTPLSWVFHWMPFLNKKAFSCKYSKPRSTCLTRRRPGGCSVKPTAAQGPAGPGPPPPASVGSWLPPSARRRREFRGHRQKGQQLAKRRSPFRVCHFLWGRKSAPGSPQEILPQHPAPGAEPHSTPGHQGSRGTWTTFLSPGSCVCCQARGSAVRRDQETQLGPWTPCLELAWTRSPMFGS